MYEIAHLVDGKLKRGGIKADLETAAIWLGHNAEEYGGIWVIVPASEDALTEDECFDLFNAERREENYYGED